MADDVVNASPLERALSHAWANVKRWRKLPFAAIEHGAVLAHLAEEGGISARYCVLTALSCGIAILGLLLSSAAVVIGAMLISPLMDPIILFGFSLATLNARLAIRSLKAILLGMLLAISQSALIVWLSPLTAVTPEILARTRPNFFDLLVAVLSAVAGAYAVAHRKGETIVGVAIATALMPPLAVIGYGAAVQNWVIFGGAGGLFMTNLLAIGLTASLVAKFFGFGPTAATRASMWHTVGIFAVFAILSIPLGLSLKQLANEALVTSTVRSALKSYFARYSDHIYGVTVAFSDNQSVEIEALVLTTKQHPGAEAELEGRLQAVLARPVNLTLSQIPVRPSESLDRQAIQELVSQSNVNLAKQIHAKDADMALVAAAESGVPVLDISVDKVAKSVVVRQADAGLGALAQLRAADVHLTTGYPEWRFTFRVNAATLPAIPFAAASTSLNPQNNAVLDDVIWALKEGGIQSVLVAGFSDSHGEAAANRRAALARARTVAAYLALAGISATPISDYPVPDQKKQEMERGLAYFRQARIQLPAASAP